MSSLIPLFSYSKIFYVLMFIICTLYSIVYLQSNSCRHLLTKQSVWPATILAILLIIYIGYRPISWIFQDMCLYAHVYNNIIGTQSQLGTEWAFDGLMKACHYIGLTDQYFFVVVALLYIGLGFHACQKILWENVPLALLFFISAFSFWAYGTNGIRSGLAGSIVLLGIAYGLDKKWWVMIIAFILAIGTHKSTILPITCFLLAIFSNVKPQNATKIWLASIILSLIAGPQITAIVGGLGFDDRMANYLVIDQSIAQQFSHTGFRWDFLLYSAVPIVLAWYVKVDKNIHDRVFDILSSTYILSNAMWILVIRSGFSNRFAYLSWFMYPIVIGYAVIRLPIWDNQDKQVGRILLAHSGFTMLMFLIGKLY